MKGTALAALAMLALAAPLAAQEAAGDAAAGGARGEVFDRLPYWPGYWVGEGSIGTAISGIGRVADSGATTSIPGDSIAIWNNKAPWNEEGRRRVADVVANQGGRKGLGWGFPLMMNSSTPVQFLITPEEVLIVNAYNEVRHVYTDGRDHPPVDDLWPTVTGNSIGRWEGDTLVIDTIMVTNPNVFFQGNPPLSEEAHYVERIRLDGDRLVSHITITDPVTLSGPWVANTALVREEAFDRMIQVDWNNDRTGVEGDTNTIEPPAD